MLNPIRPALRRRGALLAAGTAVVLAVGGGTTAAFAAGSGEQATAASTTCATAPHLRALLHGAEPKQFREDLKHLRSEPKDQRADDRKAIRQKALEGAYGDRVERVAHLFGHAGKGHGWLAQQPAALQSDLKALRALKPKSDERLAKAKAIATKAIDGGYGTAVQTRAKAAQERIQQRCAAKTAK